MSAPDPIPSGKVRWMRHEDLEAVMAIERESFSSPWSERSFRVLLNRADADLWVLEVDGAVVGYAIAWYVADEAELGNLAIASGWRRRGLGARLLDRVVEHARARGTKRIFLEVRASNRAAQGLYRGRGFRSVGLRTRYYRDPVEDGIAMRLELDPEARDERS